VRTAAYKILHLLIGALAIASGRPCVAQHPWNAARTIQLRIPEARAAGLKTPVQLLLVAELAAESAHDRYPSPDALAKLADNLAQGGPRLMQIAPQVRALVEQWSLPSDASLAEMCRKWATDCTLADADRELDEQGQQLRAALDGLERQLVFTGNDLSTWRPYLYWPETYRLPERSDFDGARLDELETRWTNATLIWNDPELAHAAFVVRRFIERLRRTGDPNFPVRTSKRFEELVELLSADAAATSEARPSWAAALAEIEPYGVAPELTTAIRRRLSYPNMVIQLAPDILAQNRPVNETFHVDQIIARARAVGTGRLTGELSWERPPLPDFAGWQWLLKATSVADTSSTQSGVQVDSRSTTALSGSKVFHWDASGPSMAPATSTAATTIISTSISAGGPFRRRRATDATNASRSSAEAESAASARQSMCERLDREGQALLAALGQHYHRAVKAPIGQSLQFVTTIRAQRRDKVFEWACWLESPRGLAAPQPAPKFSEDTGVGMSVHETFLERYAAVHLAGRTLTATELSTALKGWVSSEIGDTQSGQNAPTDTWSLTLLGERPVTCRIENGLLHLHLRVKEFVTPESVFPPVSVRISLQPRSLAGGWTLTREGPVEVHPLDFVPRSGQQLTGRQLSLRRAVQRKLEGTLGDEFRVRPWRILATGPDSVTLLPRQIQAADGWLAIEWQVDAVPSSTDVP
jgi:hypothetical protein